MKTLSLAFYLCLIILSRWTVAQEAAPQYTSEQLQRYIRDTLAEYQMRSGEKLLKVSDKPVLNWQNTIRMGQQGVYVCWFDGKRPLAIGSVYTYLNRDLVRAKHQWISLTDKPLEGTLEGEVVWKPTKSTALRNVVPKADAPQSTDVRRLIQMRQIARRFKGNSIDPMDQVTHLELMPQPLLRYSVPEEGLIDGAIFAFVVTTDPDILLVLEAVEKDVKKQWEYVLFPCHFWALRASLDEQEVWNSKSQMVMQDMVQGQQPEMTFPYISFHPRKKIPIPSDL